MRRMGKEVSSLVYIEEGIKVLRKRKVRIAENKSLRVK